MPVSADQKFISLIQKQVQQFCSSKKKNFKKQLKNINLIPHLEQTLEFRFTQLLSHLAHQKLSYIPVLHKVYMLVTAHLVIHCIMLCIS